MSSIVPSTNTEIFVREIRALCPDDQIDPKNLSAIDQKIQEFILDPRFQFPQIAGRLKDLRVSIQRVLHPASNQKITSLDYNGISNKINTLIKLAQGRSLINSLLNNFLDSIDEDPLNNIQHFLNSDSALMCDHFKSGEQEDSIPTLILSFVFSSRKSSQVAHVIIDLLFRAGCSPNNILPFTTPFTHRSRAVECNAALMSIFFQMINEPEHFERYIDLLDLYLEYGADVNLQPSKKLHEFIPTSTALIDLIPLEDDTIISLLRYLIEAAQFNVNMTHVHYNGAESTMLYDAVHEANTKY